MCKATIRRSSSVAIWSGPIFSSAVFFRTVQFRKSRARRNISQTFWDYFLFDYRLLADDKTPLQHYHDVICHDASEMDTSVDILNELIKAKLVLFDVQRRTEEGMYVCRNIFTNEKYTLMLPVDDNIDTEGLYFHGAIFFMKILW